MTFLPIVARELRVASRRKATYWSRVAVGLLGVVFGGYLIFIINLMGLGRLGGRSILPILGFPLMIYSFFSGLASADSLSGEKREGTLGLLFLTDLKGYDIVLGKLCATGIVSFYGLLATIPVVAFSLTLGGITPGEVWRACLLLINAMFFSHAVAMMTSAFTTQLRLAASMALGLLLFIVIFLPSLSALLYQHNHFTLGWILQFINPITPAKAIVNVGLKSSLFWGPLFASHGVGWIFLALASWQAPRSWQDKADSSRFRWRERIRQWTYGRPNVRAAYQYRLLEINPFFWLISRVRLKAAFIWSFLILIFLGFGFVCFKTRDRETIVGVFIFTQILLHAAIKVGIASEASWAIEEQRQNGGLEFLICCTPLNVQEILRGCWTSLSRLFLGPLIVIFLADIALWITLLFHLPDYAPAAAKEDTMHMFWCASAATIMLPLDAFALGWVGLWMGLSAKKPRQAGGGAIVRILVVPWMVFGLLSAVFAIASEFFNFIPSIPFWLGLTIWFGLSVAVDVLFTLPARRNLLTRFRAMAVPSYEEPIGFFGRMGRILGLLTKTKSPPESR